MKLLHVSLEHYTMDKLIAFGKFIVFYQLKMSIILTLKLNEKEFHLYLFYDKSASEIVMFQSTVSVYLALNSNKNVKIP